MSGETMSSPNAREAVPAAGHAGQPTVSLIITTYNRPRALDRVLASVAAQAVPPVQVLVADDGSGPETSAVLARWRERLGDRLLHCWQPDEGFRVTAARNRAIRDAVGDLLVFVDGDCLMRHDFIAQHQSVAERGFATAGNRVLLSEALTRRIEAGTADPTRWGLFSWLWAWLLREVNRPWGLLRLPGQRWRRLSGQPWALFKTCNCAVWRDDMLALNGFEEEIEGWGFEDTDLILRWFNRGGRLKMGRFGTTVLHLWHPEAARHAAAHNERRAREAGASGDTRARRGLAERAPEDRHQPTREPAP